MIPLKDIVFRVILSDRVMVRGNIRDFLCLSCYVASSISAITGNGLPPCTVITVHAMKLPGR